MRSADAGPLGIPGDRVVNLRIRTELVLTGFWLGVSQVGLAFHLLFTQGAHVVHYFMLLTLWLSGSACGLLYGLRKMIGIGLAAGGLLLYFATAGLSNAPALTAWSLAVIIMAVLAHSGYAGWYLRSRVQLTNAVREVLMFENIGFVCGYTVAACSLFFSIAAINLTSLISGCSLLLYLCLTDDAERPPHG